MFELIKYRFDLFIKHRWLKTIDKACNKYNKLSAKARHQAAIINALIKRYNELYGENLRGNSDAQ